MAASATTGISRRPAIFVILLVLLWVSSSFGEAQAAAPAAGPAPKSAAPKPPPAVTPSPAKVPARSPLAKAPVAAPTLAPTKSPIPAPVSAPASAPVSPTSPAASPSAGPAPAAGNATGGALDASQALALESLGLTVGPDVCTSQPTQIGCDNGAPRHVTLLGLQYCPPTVTLSEAALANLSTLTSLSFLDCPLPIVPWPAALAASLTSFTASASLGRTAEHPELQGLPGWWVGKLHGLRQLTILDVLVNASSVDVILSNMSSLTDLTIQTTNLSGPLPTAWSTANLTLLDLSNNKLTGNLSASIGKLTQLTQLNLGSNSLGGTLSPAIGALVNLNKLHLNNNKFAGEVPASLANLTSLVYLDLSNNRLNGSVPAAIGAIATLRYLDLSNNSFAGPIPFTPAFLNQLNTFIAGGNPRLCYNATMLSAKLAAGLPPCDPSGFPVPVPGASSPYGLAPASAPKGALAPQSGAAPVSRPAHHGPKTVVWAAAIAVGVIIALIVIIVVVSKCCNTGKD